MVSPPLYASEPMARSSAGRVRCVFRLNSVRASLLYWTTATRVLSSPIWKAPAVAEMKLRMYLKFGLPTFQEPSTRNTTSAMALTEHSGEKKKWGGRGSRARNREREEEEKVNEHYTWGRFRDFKKYPTLQYKRRDKDEILTEMCDSQCSRCVWSSSFIIFWSFKISETAVRSHWMLNQTALF